ncbi:hypothetical protein X566_17530 [Afipia sp. P52-10]|nr:hypothetical protein X566_17530 [Afipia sp. P52-10]
MYNSIIESIITTASISDTREMHNDICTFDYSLPRDRT